MGDIGVGGGGPGVSWPTGVEGFEGVSVEVEELEESAPSSQLSATGVWFALGLLMEDMESNLRDFSSPMS